MQQPEGFIRDKDKVCLLNRAVYGLKQSSRVWHTKVEEVLSNAGYKKSVYEPCIFINVNDKCFVIIALYVDDFLIFYNDENERERIGQILADNFKVKNLGEVKQFLGLNIRLDRENHTVKVDQNHFVNELITKFGLENAKPASTPMEACLKLDKEKCSDDSLPYQCLIGSLIYLATNSRPDIAFAVNYLSQHNNCYSSVHFNHAKRILRYLKGTQDYGLIYKKNRQIGNWM